MRTIRYTAFKRDYKREKSGKSRQHAEKLDGELTDVVALLAADASLPRRYADVENCPEGNPPRHYVTCFTYAFVRDY